MKSLWIADTVQWLLMNADASTVADAFRLLCSVRTRARSCFCTTFTSETFFAHFVCASFINNRPTVYIVRLIAWTRTNWTMLECFEAVRVCYNFGNAANWSIATTFHQLNFVFNVRNNYIFVELETIWMNFNWALFFRLANFFFLFQCSFSTSFLDISNRNQISFHPKLDFFSWESFLIVNLVWI